MNLILFWEKSQKFKGKYFYVNQWHLRNLMILNIFGFVSIVSLN